MADTLRINEIFFSIQGESTRAGLPCLFVRLTGCHLRCVYCDTEYAFHEGQSMTIDAIVAEGRRVAGGAPDLVEITGGEPLLQPGVHKLMARFFDEGAKVLIETSGACDISTCDPRVIRILDLKTPDSGEVERNLLENLEHLKSQDEVKFVIMSEGDYRWARDVIRRHDLSPRVGAVLLSPVHEMPLGAALPGCAGLEPALLAAWMLADRLGPNVRMQNQMHKWIWDPQARGV